jgi:acyl transferase domain-containing protein
MSPALSGAMLSRFGVYLGIFAPEYATLVEKAGVAISPYHATSSTSSVAAGRLSFMFNFKVGLGFQPA